jgi:hypothetical protein
MVTPQVIKYLLSLGTLVYMMAGIFLGLIPMLGKKLSRYPPNPQESTVQ